MTKITPLLAVIDLGTNTFHLLIAHFHKDNTFQEIYRERRFVKMAEDGIAYISPQAWARGMDAMTSFAKAIASYDVQRARAIGTAALRTAGNGPDFIREVREQTGILIELIDGQEEARLIHRGVSLMDSFDESTRLLMDIGGGSVEFILADAQKVYWSQSFPIGVAVLYRRFHTADPIPVEQQQALRLFLAEALQPLAEQLIQHPVRELVGASGTFDVLETYLSDPSGPAVLEVTTIAPFRDRLVAMPIKERLQMEDMPPARAEMLPVALILLDVILALADIELVRVSPYALKEGVLSEMQPTH